MNEHFMAPAISSLRDSAFMGGPRILVELLLAGTATKIDTVEIRWPSGAVDMINNVAADKLYGVLEGQGVVSLAQVRTSPTSPHAQ
jgi:hypothetical protein